MDQGWQAAMGPALGGIGAKPRSGVDGTVAAGESGLTHGLAVGGVGMAG